jgi:hypothetical protein
VGEEGKDEGKRKGKGKKWEWFSIVHLVMMMWV